VRQKAGGMKFYAEINMADYIEEGYLKSDNHSGGLQILITLKENNSSILKIPHVILN
jgi:hypothetical protein